MTPVKYQGCYNFTVQQFSTLYYCSVFKRKLGTDLLLITIIIKHCYAHIFTRLGLQELVIVRFQVHKQIYLYLVFDPLHEVISLSEEHVTLAGFLQLVFTDVSILQQVIVSALNKYINK